MVDIIAREIERERRALIRNLQRVDRTGWIARKNEEPYLISDLIAFGGPRPEIGNQYNCFRLTPNGRAELAAAQEADHARSL
jgi:hypothetical protein